MQGVKQSVLSVCHRLLSVVVTKITRSPDLGIWAAHKYNETVKICKKLASLCFESFGKVHECHKYCVFIGHTYRLQAMTLRFLLMHTILYSGKFSREKTFADQWEWPFCRENFHRMLKPNIGKYGKPRFRGENFRGWISNHEICESFLPRKFSAIQ